MKKSILFLSTCLFISVALNLHAQGRVLNQQVVEEYRTALQTNEIGFYLAQREAENWQPYVEDLYRSARLLKNSAYILSTASFVLYITMHHRISFGDYETDDIKQSLTQLNLLCGGAAIVSLMLYTWGNSLQHEANQIIIKNSFSLQVGKDGIGIVYKL